MLKTELTKQKLFLFAYYSSLVGKKIVQSGVTGHGAELISSVKIGNYSNDLVY